MAPQRLEEGLDPSSGQSPAADQLPKTGQEHGSGIEGEVEGDAQLLLLPLPALGLQPHFLIIQSFSKHITPRTRWDSSHKESESQSSWTVTSLSSVLAVLWELLWCPDFVSLGCIPGADLVQFRNLHPLSRVAALMYVPINFGNGSFIPTSFLFWGFELRAFTY